MLRIHFLQLEEGKQLKPLCPDSRSIDRRVLFSTKVFRCSYYATETWDGRFPSSCVTIFSLSFSRFEHHKFNEIPFIP